MSPQKLLNKKIRQRYFIITAFIILIFIAIFWRAFVISFLEGSEWQKLGKIPTKTNVIQAARGNIYSSDYQLMATSEYRFNLYIDFWAKGIDKDTLNEYLPALAAELNKVLPEKSAEYYKKHIQDGWKNREKEARNKNAKGEVVRKTRRYKLLNHAVNYIQWKQIEKMPFFKKGRNQSGLYEDTISMRVNPYGTLALRTIGSIYGKTEANGKIGKSGLENYYDSLLRGKEGTAILTKVDGKSINKIEEKPIDGKDIITTIDITIQDITEKALVNKLKSLNAASGTAVVMEVATGEIKAITNMGRSGETYKETQNYAVSDLTEPGSTFKVVSMMVALEDGLVHPNDSVDTGNGVVEIAGERLEDHNANRGGYGMISAAQSIQYSSNIGVAKLITKAYHNDPSKYVDGIYRIGLDKDLELEIPGYAVARIQHPKDPKQYWDRTALPWMSFGYRTRIPPIYTLTFFNAIANNGVMVKPLFVKEIREGNKTIEKKKPQVINNRICSESTLNAIRLMLDSVVNHPRGTGKPACSEYIRIAGKTGTAQISHGASGYKAGGLTHQVSFCGFFPIENPRYSCIVVIRSPGTGGASGGQMCGTVFKEIAEEIYAQNKIPTPNIFPVDTIRPLVPKIKCGLVEYTHYALKKLDVSYTDSLNGLWVIPYLHENKIVLKDRNIVDNLVPNVVGMGAKDAVYALESAGLKVSLSGKGTIVNQSIGAGTRVVKGQTVAIQLK